MPQLSSLPKTPVIHMLGAGNMPKYLLSQALAQGTTNFLVTTSSAESTFRNVEALKQTFPNARITAETSCFDPRIPTFTGKNPLTALICVKPQVFKEMTNFPSNFTKPDTFVVSMMAGVANSTIQEKLDLNTQPVRIMPNLPAKVGCGVVGLLRSADFTQDDRQGDLETLLSRSNVILNVPEEDGLHWVTAVAGSGPAFAWEVVKRVEHLVEAAAKEASGQAPDQAAVKNTSLALVTQIAQTGLAQEPISKAHADKINTFPPNIDPDNLLDTSDIKDQVREEIMAFVAGTKAAALSENATQTQSFTLDGAFQHLVNENGLGADSGGRFESSLSENASDAPLVSDHNLTAAIYGTLLGSARLYAESSDSLPDLQTAVRSKKGTTDAGLNVLTARNTGEPHLSNTQPITEDVAKDTIMAAIDRSKALRG